MEKDELDIGTEYGGTVKFKENSFLLTLKDFPSDHITRNMGISKRCADNIYIRPYEAETDLKLFDYHYHSRKSDEPGPSISINDLGNVYGDMGSSILNVDEQGEEHDIVITNRGNKTFNIAYYGGEKLSDGSIEMTVLEIGNYKYD